jgi:regulator of replication initiation timing
MARQYKVMQEELIKRNNTLDLQVAHLKEQLELTHIVLEETKREKDKLLDEKNGVIIEQTRKMELMALEFTEMLKVSCFLPQM